jgi:antirestriction protein
MSKVLKTETELKTLGVYFANLEAYNNGRMVGGWLYPLEYESFTDFEKAIAKITRFADEIAVHDYDDFPNMGEYPNHESIYNLAHALDNSYLDNEIIIKYFNDYYGYDFEDLEGNLQDIEDNFMSIYDTFKDFADEKADEDILDMINKDAQQFVFNNFDYDSYARDLRQSYNVIDLDNYKVAIFYQY